VGLKASENNDSSVMIDGRVDGGLAGEPISISIYSPRHELIKNTTVAGNTKDQFVLYLSKSEAAPILRHSGSYEIVATHLPTGIQGSTILNYSVTIAYNSIPTKQPIIEQQQQSPASLSSSSLQPMTGVANNTDSNNSLSPSPSTTTTSPSVAGSSGQKQSNSTASTSPTASNSITPTSKNATNST
jgi:hypothetical protein